MPQLDPSTPLPTDEEVSDFFQRTRRQTAATVESVNKRLKRLNALVKGLASTADTLNSRWIAMEKQWRDDLKDVQRHVSTLSRFVLSLVAFVFLTVGTVGGLYVKYFQTRLAAIDANITEQKQNLADTIASLAAQQKHLDAVNTTIAAQQKHLDEVNTSVAALAKSWTELQLTLNQLQEDTSRDSESTQQLLTELSNQQLDLQRQQQEILERMSTPTQPSPGSYQ